MDITITLRPGSLTRDQRRLLAELLDLAPLAPATLPTDASALRVEPVDEPIPGTDDLDEYRAGGASSDDEEITAKAPVPIPRREVQLKVGDLVKLRNGDIVEVNGRPIVDEED